MAPGSIRRPSDSPPHDRQFFMSDVQSVPGPLASTSPLPLPVAPQTPTPGPRDAGDVGRANKETYFWTGGENEYASRGRTAHGALIGVPRFSFGLNSPDLWVHGATMFRADRLPTSGHGPETANHD